MGGNSYTAGAIVAAYEYDAFGNTIRESGSFAASNNFRFSTKYADLETGLIYYGLRYYSPSQGRFITKDPIEEQGGLNLYAFCSNNVVNAYDYLGMDAYLVYDGAGHLCVDSGGDSWEDLDNARIRAANNQNWMNYAEGVAAGALDAVDQRALAAVVTAVGNGQVTGIDSNGNPIVTGPNAQAVQDAIAWSLGAMNPNAGSNYISTTVAAGIAYLNASFANAPNSGLMSGGANSSLPTYSTVVDPKTGLLGQTDSAMCGPSAAWNAAVLTAGKDYVVTPANLALYLKFAADAQSSNGWDLRQTAKAYNQFTSGSGYVGKAISPADLNSAIDRAVAGSSVFIGMANYGQGPHIQVYVPQGSYTVNVFSSVLENGSPIVRTWSQDIYTTRNDSYKANSDGIVIIGSP